MELLEATLTEVVRLARDPRLTARNSGAIDEAVDRRLLLLLSLVVDREPLRAADLVDVMAVDQSTVSRQVSALVEHGMLERTPDPDDRRASLVTSTAKGREAIAGARREWRHTLADLTGSWTAAQRDAFVARLSDLAAGLDGLLREAGDES
jgi:DNA-binding MarR family transcriptional regulator